MSFGIEAPCLLVSVILFRLRRGPLAEPRSAEGQERVLSLHGMSSHVPRGGPEKGGARGALFLVPFLLHKEKVLACRGETRLRIHLWSAENHLQTASIPSGMRITVIFWA